MDTNGKRILVLGAYGQVGSAIVKLMLRHSKPAHFVLCSLHKSESDEILEQCKLWTAEFQATTPVEERTTYSTRHGDMLRTGKLEKLFSAARATTDDQGNPLDADERARREAEFTAKTVEFVFKDYNLFSAEEKSDINLLSWILEDKPDIIIDCVNTATGLAYMDIFSLGKKYLAEQISGSGVKTNGAPFCELVLSSAALPALIRHVEILKNGMDSVGTKLYIKIGTTGTGGMGLNIPYTHSESKPSRQLMSKTAVAGASSLLYLLYNRTKDAPVIKEIKPAALIGWKGIGYGPIRKHGAPIDLYDCPLDKGRTLDELKAGEDTPPASRTGESLEGVFIDTGENGVFSSAEFETISSLEQMEMVTPEDVARVCIEEINGESTGFDIIGSLSAVCLDSTYRAGLMRNHAVEQLMELEAKHGESVAYEILGPPKLSKLLWEAYLLKHHGKLTEILKPIFDEDTVSMARKIEMFDEAYDPEALCEQVLSGLAADDATRQRIISIGVPICTKDRRWLYGDNVALMRAFPGRKIGELLGDAKMQRYFLDNGAVELLPSNIERWQGRLREALRYHFMFNAEGTEHTSSAYDYRRLFTIKRNAEGAVEDVELHIGELVAWMFITEEAGPRRRHVFHPGK